MSGDHGGGRWAFTLLLVRNWNCAFKSRLHWKFAILSLHWDNIRTYYYCHQLSLHVQVVSRIIDSLSILQVFCRDASRKRGLVFKILMPKDIGFLLYSVWGREDSTVKTCQATPWKPSIHKINSIGLHLRAYVIYLNFQTNIFLFFQWWEIM